MIDSVSQEPKVGTAPVAELRLPIATLKADPKNPRRISSEAAHGLGISLETFGDLSGIAFNDGTGEIVSGHQRLDQLKASGAIEVVRTGDVGYIVHPKTGERFPVRFVRWDATKQRMANLVANNPEIGGEFTEDALAQLKELENEAGFELLALDELEKELAVVLEGADATGGEGSEDQSAELRENFQIVITCVDEAHQSTLLERFTEEGLKCRALI